MAVDMGKQGKQAAAPLIALITRLIKMRARKHEKACFGLATQAAKAAVTCVARFSVLVRPSRSSIRRPFPLFRVVHCTASTVLCSASAAVSRSESGVFFGSEALFRSGIVFQEVGFPTVGVARVTPRSGTTVFKP